MSKTFFKALEQELDSFCFSMGYEKRVEKDLKKRYASVDRDIYGFTTFIYSKPITANVELKLTKGEPVTEEEIS